MPYCGVRPHTNWSTICWRAAASPAVPSRWWAGGPVAGGTDDDPGRVDSGGGGRVVAGAIAGTARSATGPGAEPQLAANTANAANQANARVTAETVAPGPPDSSLS